ncbi:MAG: DUF5666 domain-containing protein [Dehalococcoidia bacterium]
MDKGFEAALDECLAAMAEGLSLEECLERFPQHAQRLRPFLETAAQVGGVAPPSASHTAPAVARQRFMARAAQLRQVQQRRRPLLLRPAVLAAALAIVVLAGSGFTAAAATRSQPDSLLYPIKLRLEDARLWFAFSEGDRIDLMLDRVERRLGEVRWLMEHDKPVGAKVLSALRSHTAALAGKVAADDVPPSLAERARALLARQEELLVAAQSQVAPRARRPFAEALARSHNGLLRLGGADGDAASIAPEQTLGGVMQVKGLVEAQQGDAWKVGGATIAVVPATLVEGVDGDPVGRHGVVTVARAADGSQRVLRIVLTDRGPEPMGFSLRGIVENVGRGRLRIGGRELPLGPHVLRLGRPRPGNLVEVRGVVSQGGEHRIEILRSPPAAAAANRLVYEGLIESVESRRGHEYWGVSGRRFEVGGAIIDAAAQPYAIGARVRVEAERRGDDLVAQRVLVLPGPGKQDEVELEGIALGSRGRGWTVAGIPVASTDTAPRPDPGTYVRVTGRLSAQGQVVAEEVVAFPPDLLRLEGILQAVGDGRWSVARVPIVVDQETQVTGAPKLGARVVVWIGVDASGRWLARYVEVLDAATSR